MIAQLLIAFTGGILSFLSPCVLPLVPVYIGFMSGVSIQAGASAIEKPTDRRRLITTAITFVLGFSVVFIALGASATALGGFLKEYQVLLSRIGGVLIILLALHLLGVFRINALLREKRIEMGQGWAPGPVTAFVTGMVFAFGWTPCVGPILAPILLIASQGERITEGILLLSAYSLGMAIPFLLVAFATDFALRFMQNIKRHFRKIEIASGVLLLLVGALLLSNQMTTLANYASKVPGLAQLEDLVTIEGRIDTGENVLADATPAPEDGGIHLTLTTLEGETVELADYRGQVVLLNYWAPWCGPCKKEMPLLSELHEALGDEDLVVVGVTMDYGSVDEVAEIVAEREVVYPVLLGGPDADAPVDGVRVFPTNFLLDRSGRIVNTREGEFHAEDIPNLTRRIREVLAQEDDTPGEPPEPENAPEDAAAQEAQG